MYLMEISMGDGRELLPDGLQQPKSNVETIVGSMSQLIVKPHCSEWTTSPRGAIECSSRVPSAIQITHEKIANHTYMRKHTRKLKTVKLLTRGEP